MKPYITCMFGKCSEHGRKVSKWVIWAMRLVIFLLIACGLTFLGSLFKITGVSLRSIELFGEILADRLFPEFKLFSGGQE